MTKTGKSEFPSTQMILQGQVQAPTAATKVSLNAQCSDFMGLFSKEGKVDTGQWTSMPQGNIDPKEIGLQELTSILE